MPKNDYPDNLHDATIARWARKKEKLQDEFEEGANNLKNYLKTALGKLGTETRQNVARDLLDARRNRRNNLDQGMSSWSNKDDDIVTGMEDLPWDRDVE